MDASVAEQTALSSQAPRMWLNPKLYRIRLSLDILRIFVFPCVVLSQACRRWNVNLGFFTPPAYVAAIILWGWIRNVNYDIQQWRHARRLGAKPVPRIKGKWPGNIDVLLRMMKAFKTAYLMDVYLELFQEYKCTTLNTRILWVDQVNYLEALRIMLAWVLTSLFFSRSSQWMRSISNSSTRLASITFGVDAARKSGCESSSLLKFTLFLFLSRTKYIKACS